MPVVHRFGQGIRDAGPDTDHGGFLDAELHGDGVGGLEADAADVARRAIWVFRHHLDGVGAIGLEYSHGPRRADAVAVEEHHDLAHDLLFGPGRDDTLRAHRSDPVDLTQAVGLGLDHVKYVLAEDSDQLLGVNRANAADHALDRWRRSPQEPGLELLAMGAIVHPFSQRRDPLAGRDGCGVAYHRHEVAVPARLRPQHAEAVLRIVKGDALDEARPGLPRSMIPPGDSWGLSRDPVWPPRKPFDHGDAEAIRR
jgi:hypothetical protein